jgi:hypothetical protein
MNMYHGVSWNGMLIYNKKTKAIRNEIQLDGINQFSTPVLTDNPETNYSANGSFTKKTYHFSLRLNTRLSWFNYSQTLNSVTTTNERTSQDVGLLFKTAYRKWPNFSVGYNKGYSQFSGITKSNFETDALTVDADVTFFKLWTFKFEYENLKNTNNNNQSNFYDIVNTSLRYQKKNSAFGFELSVNNLLDNKIKNDYSFSDYLISERTTFVLPRVFMFSVSYKL